MKRWDAGQMLDIGKKLFAKIHRQKMHTHHNHDVHFLAREIDDWLPQGVEAMVAGSYTPRCLKRYYFQDEMVDQLHVSDRIFQHILLKQLKSTFKHVMNPYCYHLDGPTGVKYATERIKQVLAKEKPQYVIRADIKSFYKSIMHFRLIQDIKKYYHDPKLLVMLESIITNPIDAPRGYKNPINGIALRGPLSQFFSGIYLKPLDDAFDQMNVTYLRYQDDILILCKTKRQMNRCRRRMMEVLHERGLSLSRKKSRIGSIKNGFHFLGINYSLTQPENNTKVTHANDVQYLNDMGGVETYSEHQNEAKISIIPHPRTLRKARIQVQQMVTIGLSTNRIRRYLHQFLLWWAKTSGTWQYHELINWFVESCWDINPAAYAAGLLQRQFKKLHTELSLVGVIV